MVVIIWLVKSQLTAWIYQCLQWRAIAATSFTLPVTKITGETHTATKERDLRMTGSVSVWLELGCSPASTNFFPGTNCEIMNLNTARDVLCCLARAVCGVIQRLGCSPWTYTLSVCLLSASFPLSLFTRGCACTFIHTCMHAPTHTYNSDWMALEGTDKWCHPADRSPG